MAEERATDVHYQPTIHEMPAGERPRERLERYGAAALSNAELMAIILRGGVKGQSVLNLAQALLARHGGLMGLARASFAELCAEHGVGPAKTTQIKAALELGRRLLIESPDARPQITSPADAANLVQLEMSLLEKEEVRVLVLDTRNRVLDIPTVYVGSLNTSVVRVAELFRDAIKQNAAAIIVVHNHPSGDPTPSPEDVRLTEMLVEAGKLLDVEVLDHLIIGQGRFVSLKERGLGFR
ncbi:MAG: DNA repair protein RadC [Anaerolineae bacterium]|nr:MAG: DNA repair protein RadC [Anaerolineae bacterium]